AGVEVERALAGAAANMRYRDPASAQRTLLSAAAPVRDAQGVLGAVVVRQSSETYLSLTDQAFSRLLGYSLLALCAGALGLLAYATVLSLRIHALSRSAHEAIGQDGRVLDNFRRSRARDEIGDLSRQYGDLLARLREYNDYLRTLSRKLSHELRTPIAVIQSSLDNIEQADTDAARQTYLPRAREGLRRLQHILSAMSEANGLEESIRNQSLGATDLVPLLREVHAAYREIYPQQQLALDLQPETAVVEAVPELLVQALDKLMDNAASFTQAGGVITLELRSSGEHYTLAVANEGPTLDEHAAERMFEPMVSLREDSGEAVHLGLGLHIVRLIVDFHRGRVQADNLPGGRGVVITIELPAAQDGASLQTPAA
ncbi:MAG: ATP-binding protein, partial [Halioglobus sp.]|nr:ATP-binding protein [Halioglobus sp.]